MTVRVRHRDWVQTHPEPTTDRRLNTTGVPRPLLVPGGWMLGPQYERALLGERCWLRHDDGERVELPVDLWLGVTSRGVV